MTICSQAVGTVAAHRLVDHCPGTRLVRNLLSQNNMNLKYPGEYMVLSMSLVACMYMQAAAAPKSDPKQDKVNVLVGLLNTYSKQIHGYQRNYAWVSNADTGPTCKEKSIKPFSQLVLQPGAIDGYNTAINKKPVLPADAAALKLLQAVSALEKPINELGEYYATRKYNGDNCKRGQELHPAVVVNFKLFNEAERELRAFVVAYNDELDAKLMAETKKKYGEGFRLQLERQLGDAKALIGELDAQFQTDKPDVVVIAKFNDALSATVTSTLAMISKVKETKTDSNKKIYDELYQGGYERMVRAGETLSAQVKRVIEQVSAKPGSSSLDSQLKNAFNNYNEMVQMLNKVKLSKNVK
jgi:hypothetical protein